MKKHFNDKDIHNECLALKEASLLCTCKDSNGNLMRGPYLALVAMGSKINKSIVKTEEWIFKEIQKAYVGDMRFTDTVGYIVSLDSWSIFKRRPKNKKIAEYIYFEHNDGEEHIGLQFLLTGTLSVYYDKTRNFIKRPGFTAFPSGRAHDKLLGTIETNDTN